MRKALSSFVGLGAVLWLLLGLGFSLGSGAIIESTIEDNRAIEASFQKTAAFVEQFRRDHSRLPNDDEFKDWSGRQPFANYSPIYMELLTDKFPEGVVENFGAPPTLGYVVSYWRGEWNEYYASWTEKSSLIFDASEYYVLGSPAIDAATVIAIFAMLCFAAVKLWSATIPSLDD